MLKPGSALQGKILLLIATLALSGCNAPSPFELITTNLNVARMDDAALAAVKLERKPVGLLELPDGKVAVADPLVQPDIGPLKRQVPPGTYPVDILWSEEEQRTAIGLMRFSQAPIVRWELAARPGQDAAQLTPAEFFSVSVDTGLAMFASSRFASAVDKRMAQLTRRKKNANYYNDFLIKEMGDGVEYLIHYPYRADRSSGAAIIHSGWGDGSYPILWGLDENDKAVVLMIDFYVIDDANGIPRTQRSWLDQSSRILNQFMSHLREAAETANSNPTKQ